MAEGEHIQSVNQVPMNSSDLVVMICLNSVGLKATTNHDVERDLQEGGKGVGRRLEGAWLMLIRIYSFGSRRDLLMKRKGTNGKAGGKTK